MPDFRCFAHELSTNTTAITLSSFESHHLVTTNRARSGDSVALFNGKGLECEATLEVADRRSAVLTTNQFFQNAKPAITITLAIAVIKGKTFESILRQATELGVACIQPLLTERTQVHINKDKAKQEKWTQYLIEGCKQSGNPWLPVLKAPTPFKDFLKNNAFESAVVGSLEKQSKSWMELSLSQSTTLFIGPEGDFSPTEYELLRVKGVQPVSLGPYVLKSETAVVTGLSQLALALNKTGN
jgi:16S rRNA (uracil1498-N3)-methyltransferase